MKKICILLCVTVLMLSFSAVSFAEPEKKTEKTVCLSAPAVYIVPAENDNVHGAVSMHEFLITCGFSAFIIDGDYVAVDKYTPEIMEQIDIISVAPRE